MAKPIFAPGNNDAHGRGIGPRIVRLKGKPGFYIRWYERRQNVRYFTIDASIPHGLTLQQRSACGLTVSSPPTPQSPFREAVAAGDIIIEIAGHRVNTVEDFERMLVEVAGKPVGIHVNKGGKTGTTPRFMKAGETRADATKFLAEWQEKRSTRANGHAAHTTSFAQLADQYLKWAETTGGYSPSWLREAHRIMERHIERWGAWKLDQITTRDIEEWAEQRYREVSPATVLNELKPIRVAFRLATRKWRYTLNDPARNVEIRTPPKSIPKYLDHRQIQVLIEAACNYDRKRLQPTVSSKGGVGVTPAGGIEQMRKFYNADGTFDAARIRFLLNSALRKSQLTDLEWSQYDQERGTITLQTTEHHSEKSRRVTVIPLPEAARDIIEGQPRVSQFIFPNLTGTRDVQIGNRFARITAIAEKEVGRHIHLHMLRHTALTHLLQHSQDIALVSKYAGHSKIETTQIYAHVLEQRIREATRDFDITKGGGHDKSHSASAKSRSATAQGRG